MAQVAPCFLASSALLPPWSTVNPKPCGTYSWPISKSLFTPFLPARSLLLPKSHGKRQHPKATWSWFSPRMCGPKQSSMAAKPGFTSPCQSSSAACFWLLPQLGTPASTPLFFQPFLEAWVSLGRCGPMGGANHLQALMQVLGVACQVHPEWKSLPFPWLKAWPQLLNISMKPVKTYRYGKWPCLRLFAKLLLCRTTLSGHAPWVLSPSLLLWVWGHPSFLISPGHPEFWPHSKPYRGRGLWLHPLTIEVAQAGWFREVEHCPIHQNVVGSIPSEGTYLDCRFDPQLGHVWGATDQCLCLTMISFSLYYQLKKISPGEDWK